MCNWNWVHYTEDVWFVMCFSFPIRAMWERKKIKSKIIRIWQNYLTNLKLWGRCTWPFELHSQIVSRLLDCFPCRQIFYILLNLRYGGRYSRTVNKSIDLEHKIFTWAVCFNRYEICISRIVWSHDAFDSIVDSFFCFSTGKLVRGKPPHFPFHVGNGKKAWAWHEIPRLHWHKK